MEFGIKLPCVRFSVTQIHQLGRLLFGSPKLNLLPGDGDKVADHLSDADICGYPSHGLQRTTRYLNSVLQGFLNPRLPPTVAHQFSCNARIEGAHTLGRLAMEMVVDTALELGKQFGSAHLLTVTNHIGRMAPYLARLAEAGYLVECQVNAVGSPTTSILTKRPRLGTNPLGLAVPNPDGAPFVLDFTPSGTTEGNIRVFQVAGVDAPEGLLLDRHGQPTRDPNAIYAKTVDELGAILPFGGARMHPMAHLMSMIEMGPGALTGNISAEVEAPRPVRGVNAVLLSIVHPERAFGISPMVYADRVRKTAQFLKASPPLDPFYANEDGTVLLPGEYEAKMRRKAEKEGVLLGENVWAELQAAAQLLEVSIDGFIPLEHVVA